MVTLWCKGNDKAKEEFPMKQYVAAVFNTYYIYSICREDGHTVQLQHAASWKTNV